MKDLAAILEFYREAGVDTPLDDNPVNRLAMPEPGGSDSSAQAGRDRPPAATHDAQGMGTSPSAPSGDLAARVAEAEEIARQAGTLEGLHEALANWNGIDLAHTVPTMVFGSGPDQCRLLIVADCPERGDAADSVLWSGQTGRMADRMLAAIGRSRDDSRFAAACPWPPPGGVPSEDHQALLRPFLLRHVALCRAQIVLAFGPAALRTLIGSGGNFFHERGRWRRLELADDENRMATIEVMATFHPLYLMKNPAQKRLSWIDLLAIKTRLAETD